MTRVSRIGGIFLIAFVVGFVGVFFLESSRIQLGFEDGDNPEQSVAFLREHGIIYEISGTLQILMSVALVVGVLAIVETFGNATPSLAVNSSSVFGIFAAAGYFFNGAMRLVAARPLLYIESLSHDWGVTAYLVVQIVGIQVFAQAAIVNLGLWAIGISLVNTRRRLVPQALLWLAILPTFHVFVGIFLPFLGESPDAFFPLYILSIFGAVLWCLAMGTFLLRLKSSN